MSQENIDLHERGIEAVNARVLSDELAAETLAPGFRIENAATAVTDKTYYGAEGLREWVRDMFEGLDEDARYETCLLYTSPSPRDRTRSRMPSSA